jgi:hypothetical protein
MEMAITTVQDLPGFLSVLAEAKELEVLVAEEAAEVLWRFIQRNGGGIASFVTLLLYGCLRSSFKVLASVRVRNVFPKSNHYEGPNTLCPSP